MEFMETTVSQEYKFKGRVINTRVDQVLLPNGKPAQREVVEHTGGVCVGALTKEGEILLVRQFRYPHRKILLEVPAGKLEKGDDPLEGGKRELLEETGGVAVCYRDLGLMLPTPGHCGETIYMYGAKISHFTAPRPDQDEFVEPVKVPLEQAVQMCLSGEITDAKTQVCIMKLTLLLQQGVSFFGQEE